MNLVNTILNYANDIHNNIFNFNVLHKYFIYSTFTDDKLSKIASLDLLKVQSQTVKKKKICIFLLILFIFGMILLKEKKT